jgi:hypothetical protein
MNGMNLGKRKEYQCPKLQNKHIWILHMLDLHFIQT